MHIHPSDSTNVVPDTVLAGGLITAPAWGIWLTEINQLLTTASLGVGLAIGCARLWSLWRERRDQSQKRLF
jgi:hypothetical protein